MGNFIKKTVSVMKRHPMKIRLFLVVVLFTILFLNIHPKEIGDAFRQARPKFLVYAIILMIPNILLQVLKWHFVMRNLKPKPTYRTTLVSLVGGFFLGASTPGRSGELARGFLMPRYSKVRIASLTVVDKGFSQMVVYLSGLTVLGFVLPMPLSLIPWIAAVTMVVVIFNIHRLRPILERMLHKVTHSEMVDNGLAAFDALSFSTVLGMFIYSIIFYSTFTFQYYLMLRCFTDLPFADGLKTVPLVFLFNSMLPIAIGDFGVKEFIAVQVFSRYSIPGGAALSATLVQNVVTFLFPSLIGGFVFMLTKHPSLEEIKESREIEEIVGEEVSV